MYKGKRVGAVILARMRSERLPGKVMLSLKGKPVLQWIVERLKNSKYLDNIIIATSEDASCNPIVEMCTRLGYDYFRGSEEDILDRFVRASRPYNLDAVIRITGDCPMVDWRIVDTLISLFFTNDCVYCSNVVKRTFPVGFDVEVMTPSVLREADQFAEGVDRQHITTYIYKTHPDKYKMIDLIAGEEICYPELRVTLDTLEDYVVLHTLYELLWPNFSVIDVVETLNRIPELKQINSGVEQKHFLEG